MVRWWARVAGVVRVVRWTRMSAQWEVGVWVQVESMMEEDGAWGGG